tara:strand:- start:410 stop:544 length:135 start_codon:yes stop_codon:yes gene_type:complete
MLKKSGFTDIKVSPGIDTFRGASGEENAKQFEVKGYVFLARKPH